MSEIRTIAIMEVNRGAMGFPEEGRMRKELSNFTLRQLELFVAVAVHGSISRASDVTGVSRAVIAESIDALEKLFRIRLLWRRRAKGIELTPEGAEMLEHALALISAADDFEDKATRKPLSGILRIGCFTSLAPTVLPLLTEKYYQLYPEVELEYVTGDRQSLLNALRRGEVEIVCMYEADDDVGLATQRLYTTRLHVLLPAEHRLARERRVRVADLAHERLILLETPPSSEDILGYLQAHDVPIQIWRRATHFELVRSLVGRGLGYSLFLQHPLNMRSYEGRLIETRPLDPMPPSRHAAILWPRGRVLSRRAEVFLNLCAQHAQEIAPVPLYPEDQ